MAIAAEHNLFVLEDCAQSFGASYGGKRLGAIGTAGAFSFFPSKNLGGFGDGGMVSTNDDQLAALIRMLLKHGGKDKYNVDHIGYNARLDTFQAAILLAKFKYLDEFNSRRRHIAEIYTRELSGTIGIVCPVVTQHSELNTQNSCSHVFHQYTIRVEGGQRDVLQTHLKDAGIDSMVYYPVPLHKMKVFENRCTALLDNSTRNTQNSTQPVCLYDELKEAERAAHEVLSLPIEPLMTDEEVEAVARQAKRFCAVGDKDEE